MPPEVFSFDSKYRDLALKWHLDQAKVTKGRVDFLYAHFGIAIPDRVDLELDPEVDPDIIITLTERETGDNLFEVDVIFSNLKNNFFNAVQWDFDFPPTANYLGHRIPDGGIISGLEWFVGSLATDHHLKEGLFGAATGSEDKVNGMGDGLDDPEVIATGLFSGPFSAAFGVDIKRTKVNLSKKRLSIRGDVQDFHRVIVGV
jgi:hypothetical protein